MADAGIAVSQAVLDDLIAGPTGEEIALAQAGVRLAEAQVQVLEAQLNRFTLTSPVDGVVLDQTLRVGELAAPAATILSVADLSKLILTVYVPVNRLGEVQLEQEVQVTVESGLLGLSGSALVRDRVISFTFEEPPALVVVSVEPADGAERVPRTDAGQPTEIRVVFSEGLNPATVTLGDSFRVVDDLGDPIGGALVLAETAMADDTVVFTPAAPWSYSQAVQVIAGFAVESVRGASLGASDADDVVSGFLFEDPPPMLLV